ncbi:TPA: hypothetical protein ACGO0M_002034 [Streptococcus suis]
MATISITRDITLTKKDFEKIQSSKPTELLLDIVNKNRAKQVQPSLAGLTKLVK